MHWSALILEAIRMAPDIIKAIEQIMPGKGRSAEKLDGAVTLLKAQEPHVIDTPELEAAREAKLSADVAYANALVAAAITHGA